MALADILSTDGDVTDTKNAILQAFHALVGAAHEYAKASLGASAAILAIAMDGGPCAATYTQFPEVHKFDVLARAAIQSVGDLANVLTALHESDDESVNESYANYLVEISRTDVISALLEGASNRMEMVFKAMPENPQPAARFNSAIFSRQQGAQEA